MNPRERPQPEPPALFPQLLPDSPFPISTHSQKLFNAKLRAIKTLQQAPLSVLFGSKRKPVTRTTSTSTIRRSSHPQSSSLTCYVPPTSSTLLQLQSAKQQKDHILDFIKKRARTQRRSIWMTNIPPSLIKSDWKSTAEHVTKVLIEKRRKKLVIDLFFGFVGYSKFLKNVGCQLALDRRETLLRTTFESFRRAYTNSFVTLPFSRYSKMKYLKIGI
ncbi:hypothetical protein GEMRC1_013974 [Eukaryota sp. GEM-RC1]